MEYVYVMQLMEIKNLLIVIIVILIMLFVATVIDVLRQEKKKCNDIFDEDEDIQ